MHSEDKRERALKHFKSAFKKYKSHTSTIGVFKTLFFHLMFFLAELPNYSSEVRICFDYRGSS